MGINVCVVADKTRQIAMTAKGGIFIILISSFWNQKYFLTL